MQYSDTDKIREALELLGHAVSSIEKKTSNGKIFLKISTYDGLSAEQEWGDESSMAKQLDTKLRRNRFGKNAFGPIVGIFDKVRDLFTKDKY